MQRILALAALLFLLSVPVVFASDKAPSFVELADAPTITVDWSKAPAQSITLGGNRTLVFKNGEKGRRYMLVLKQDATGSRTVVWPASLRWPGGTPPILTSTANKTDFVGIFYDGVNYNALGFAQNY